MTQPYPDDWEQRARQAKERDNWKCRNCGRPGGRRGDNELHAHHVVPVKRYGSHHIDNLVTLCWRCHKAAEGLDDAPSIPLDKEVMDDHEFQYFKRLMKEQVEAWYDDDDKVWRLPPKNVNMERFDG